MRLHNDSAPFGAHGSPGFCPHPLPGYEFKIGKGTQLKNGTDVTIIATGLMVQEALKAAKQLEEKGISARVIDLHTIKPIDKEIIIKAVKETGAIVTTEEHNVIGGLGAAVSEVVGETCPVPVVKHGVEDEFGHSGTAEALMQKYELTPEKIIRKVKQAIALKK